MVRGGSVLLTVVLVAATLLAASHSAGDRRPESAPWAPDFVDIDPWFIGDRWVYATHAVTQFPDGTYTDTQLVVTTTVTEVLTATVRGRTYAVYNGTTSGTITTTGQLPVQGVGIVPFDLSGSATGWVWTDRSDLAIVATNQTARATGTANLPFPLPDAPLTADGATTVTFLPAEEEFDFPLETGDAWSYDVTVNTTGYAHLRADTILGPIENTADLAGDTQNRLSLWFNATESVSVPAGTFDAAHIHAVSPGGSPGDRWYNATVKNLVKTEQHMVNAPNDYVHVWVNLTSYTLAAAPWPGTILLSPQRVNPGGWLTARGTANPNENLALSIPAIPATYGTQADGTGAWSITLRAPSFDDFTPANSDVGSHGVLVFPTASTIGSDVATIQLILPDLYAGPGDLVPSDPTPLMGTVVTLNGTVHASPAVGVTSSFNVSFAVDGAELRRFALADLPAGGSRSFGADWTAISGTHAITFTADPDAAVPERDEGNNTVTILVFVSGPDLAPVNITVTSGATDFYADPAAVGYVSSPTQGRMGGSVNVTFDTANVGSAGAGSFVVTVVETLGLRGPPIGPRLLRANVTSLATGARAGPFSASWPVPSSPGVYHLNVTVDADAQIVETWETNNTFVVVVNVSGPDYRIESVDVPAKVTAGSSHTLTAVVRNDGQRDGVGPVSLAAYEDASPTPFATANVPPVPVGGNATVSLQWTAPASAASPTIRFLVDPADVLDEMIESNNEASVSVEVRDPPLTEIAVTGRNVSRTVLFVTRDARYALTATDRSGEGATAWLRIDGGPALAYVGPFRVTAEGSHAIEYWSVDGLGGVGAVRGLDVWVDDTGPETTSGSMSSTRDRAVVNLTASDGDGVGVAWIEYRIDDGDWTVYEGEAVVEGAGRHTLTYRAVDLLGNVGAEHTLAILPHSVPTVENSKPILAAAFAAVLIALGLWLQRRKPWSVASPGSLGLALGLVEVATGAASLAVTVLKMPAGFGLEIDAAILVVGLILVLRARAPPKPVEVEAVAPEATEPADAGTDK